MSQNHPPKSERRKHARAKFQETVTLHNVIESKSGNVFEVAGTALTAKAKDVSEGGIRLEVEMSPSVSRIFKLNFQVQKNKSVDVYSKLAWAREGLLGLQFIVADEEIRRIIRHYVEKTL
jgi:hypothetical protein